MARCALPLLALCLVLSPSSASAPSKLRADAGQVGVDGLVDNLMVMLHRELGRLGLGTLELPDVAGAANGLTLEASEGMLKGLSTLDRSGPAVVDHDIDHVTLTTSLTLGTLEMSYRVHAKYLFLSLTNDVGATIRQNSISMAVGLNSSATACWFGVQNVSVDVLDGIEWRITGFKAINKLVSSLLNLLVPPSKVKGWISDELNNAFRDYRVPCVAFIPGIGNSTWSCQ